MPTQTKLYNIEILPESATASKISLLDASGSFSVDLTAPSGMTSNVALSFPTSTGSLGQVMTSDGTGGQYWAASSSGKIVQVVTGSTTTQVGVTTTTWTDTTLAATITPTSASNQILILVMQACRFARTANTQAIGLRLLRDSTVIFDAPADATGPQNSYLGLANVTSIDARQNLQINYVDSPATTSAVTYKTEGRPYLTTNSGTCTFQLTSPSVPWQSTIVLMEITP